MEQNRNMSALEASTDERASPFNPAAAASERAPDPDTQGWDFASDEEENAYWAGFMDGTRNCGGTVLPRLAARARRQYPEIILSPADHAGAVAGQPAPAPPVEDTDFEPVMLRSRIDGWTPEKQREYVEALADSGSARHAAALVGMSEQSAARLRRRADARSFDLACEAAMRHGARRLRSVAFDRAINGVVRGRYYRGQLVSEERVFDNKLLLQLLHKTEKWLEPEPEAIAVAARWQPWMDALEQGAPPPPLAAEPRADAPPADAGPAVPAPVHGESEEDWDDVFDGSEVWEEDGMWLTRFPPPEGFAGDEFGAWGEDGYSRTLSPEEQAVIDEDNRWTQEQAAGGAAADLARARAERDRYFGFNRGEENVMGGDAAGLEPAPAAAEGDVFSQDAAELYEPFEPSAPAEWTPKGLSAAPEADHGGV
jgi:hypothetical protein